MSFRIQPHVYARLCYTRLFLLLTLLLLFQNHDTSSVILFTFLPFSPKMIAASPKQQQSDLSRAPSRYRRKGRSSTFSSGSGQQQPAPFSAPPVPDLLTSSSSASHDQQNIAPNSTPPPSSLIPPPNPPITSSLPLPPPSTPAALQIKPISLGYRKVYNKDSALLPFEPPSPVTQTTPNTNPFLQNDPSDNETDSVPQSVSSKTPKSPLSATFNPFNPFIQEPDSFVSKINDTAVPNNIVETANVSPIDNQISSNMPNSTATQLVSNTAIGLPAADATVDASPSKSKSHTPLALHPHHHQSSLDKLQQKIKKSTRQLESNSRILSSKVAKPSKGLTLDEIHAQHSAQKSNQLNNLVQIKFYYPQNATDSNGTSSFIESLSLNQSFSDLLKTIVIRHKHVLDSTDPDDYILWEVCPSLGLRRALRSTEYLSLVHESWPNVTSNYFQLDSYDARLNVSSVAFLAPRRDIVQSAGPSGPTFYAKCYYQVGKSWKKVHLVLNNGALTISRKSPGEQLSSKDKRTVSQLSQFDIYEVAGNIGTHPGRYIMAIRSQLRADIFVDKKDCVHVFATDDSNDFNLFRNIVFTLRSQACDKEVRDYKESLSKDPSSSQSPKEVQLSSKMGRINLNTAPDLSHDSSNGSHSSSGDPFASPNSSRSVSPSSNQKSLSRHNTVNRSRKHETRSSSSSPVRQNETLLAQQQQRKAALAQQGIQAPLPVTKQHARPTLIDSISAPSPVTGYNGTYTGPGTLPSSNSASQNSHQHHHKHSFKGLVASIGHLGSTHNNIDYDDSNMLPSRMQLQESEGMFKPDSLLAQMAKGSNAPSVATAAAAAGAYRDNTNNDANYRRGSDDREYHHRNSGERERTGLSRSETTVRSTGSRSQRLGRTMTVGASSNYRGH